jgi:multidrug efflux pump subunit AcrB
MVPSPGANRTAVCHFQLYAGGFLHSVSDVTRLLVGVHQGLPVFLGDIAQVSEGSLIPEQVRVAVTRNYGKSAEEKVNELVFELFVATGLVTLLVLFALGRRPAVVVTIIIPVVILITVTAVQLYAGTPAPFDFNGMVRHYY